MTDRPAGWRLDHVGIAVPDLEEAREEYGRILGLSPSPVEEVPGEKARLVFFDLGNCRLELIEPTSPESPVHRFLESGRSGVHHLSLTPEAGDLVEHRDTLERLGLPVIGQGLRPGSGGSTIFFLHPSAASGVLLEFSQKEGPDRERPEPDEA